MPSFSPRPLLANPSFTLLWVGDLLSGLGSQATVVAMPLLVLSLTGSPAEAGLVALARGLAYPVSALPAGVLVDRFERRAVLVLCAALDALATGSVALLLLAGRPPFAQLFAVAFAGAALSCTAAIAERGLLPAVVPPAAVPDAVALGEARESIAAIGGPPLGGALFAVARGLPFVADAVSFVAAGVAAAGVRAAGSARSAGPAGPAGRAGSPGAAGPDPPSALRAVREGFAWLWEAPFLRAGSLLYAGLNVTLAALELLAVLIARRHHASPPAIGAGFAVMGAFGVASSALARPLRGRLSPRWAALCEPWLEVAFMPLLLLCHSALSVGFVVGAMFLPMALSTSVIVGHRLTAAPEHLRGRVQASASFLAGSASWLGPLAVGVLFQDLGETGAVLVLAGWSLGVAVVATASPGLREPPGHAVPRGPRSGPR